MRLFGFEITRAQKAQPLGALQAVDGRRGVWHTLFNSDLNPGDWQKDIQIDRNAVLANWAIFACMTLIAGDVGKVRLKLVERTGRIWAETESPSFSPVLRKPNRYQTRQQFIETWVTSKLSNGNTYALKQRDDRGVVVALYVLDPHLVTPLVADDGAVFYRLGPDRLSAIGFDDSDVYVPASEIIHDRMNCLFHPLVGLSPIFASGLAAMQGLKIQQNSAKFFQNMSRPSGVLTAPGQISDETADRLKKHWDENFGGDKIGKVAVLGDDLKYQSMTVSAIDAQLTEQLKASAEMICSTFHVPAFKIGAGTIPAGQKVEDLNQIYYSDCLQAHMEAIEALLDDGLGLTNPKLGRVLGTEFDLDDLLKMDTASMIDALNKAVAGGWMAPDEARERRNLPPVPGGASPLMQQQNYSLAALAKRDAAEDPFASATTPATQSKEAPPAEDRISYGEELLLQLFEQLADSLARRALERSDETPP